MSAARWWPALKPILLGIAVGLGSVWVIDQAPERSQVWLRLGLIAIGLGFMVRLLITTRRDVRQMQALAEAMRRGRE